MSERPNYWYDATITVRVYLPGLPPEDTMTDTPEDLELELSGVLDGVTTSSGLLLSVHEVDLGEAHGYMETVPDE